MIKTRIEANIYTIAKGIYECFLEEDRRVYIDNEWVPIAECKASAMFDQWEDMSDEIRAQFIGELGEVLNKYDLGAVREIERRISNGELLASSRVRKEPTDAQKQITKLLRKGLCELEEATKGFCGSFEEVMQKGGKK